MAKYKGKELVLQAKTASGPDVFTTVSAMRTTSMTINNETVDVTDKDGAGWRELLEGAGVQSMSVKCAGIISNAAGYDFMLEAVMSNSIENFKLVSGTGAFAGDFQVASAELGGEYNKEQTYSFSLESAGTIAFT